MEALKYCGDAKKSQQCHTYILQDSTFASERPQVPKWGRQTCTGRHLTSLHPINLEISSVKKSIQSLLCCKTTMQTNCGLTNCTGNSPEAGFSFSLWRLVKYLVNNKFFTLHSYFYCCLSFSFQGGHQALSINL